MKAYIEQSHHAGLNWMEYYSFKSGINAKINYSNRSVYNKVLQFAVYVEVRYQNVLVDLESLQYNYTDCKFKIVTIHLGILSNVNRRLV